MQYMEVIMVGMLLFMGSCCSYMDFRKGIVPNRMLIVSLAIGIILHLFLYFMGLSYYYPTWAVNMLIADAISVCMYFGNLWGAGDSKLFIVLYVFVPPWLLDSGSLSYSIVPYMFIFGLAMAWIFIDTTFRLFRKEPRKVKKFDVPGFVKGYLRIAVETTAFFALLSATDSDLLMNQSMLISAMLMIYAFICARTEIMHKWYVILIHAVVLLVSWIVKAWTPVWPSWWNYGLMVAMILAQRYCSMYNYQLIHTADAKEGVVPAMETILLFQRSRVHSLPRNPSEELSARITWEEAEAIRRWEKSANGQPAIWIVRKVPFAGMIFTGFTLWILFRIWGR